MGLLIHLVRLIFRIAIWLFLQLILAARFILPWVLRFIWFLIRLVSLSVISLFVGVPTSIQRMSKRVIVAGFPVEHETALNNVMSTLAFLILLTGWIALAGTTYWLWMTFVD
jgi:hypothetical protein